LLQIAGFVTQLVLQFALSVMLGITLTLLYKAVRFAIRTVLLVLEDRELSVLLARLKTITFKGFLVYVRCSVLMVSILVIYLSVKAAILAVLLVLKTALIAPAPAAE
jgi:hypothetical protein